MKIDTTTELKNLEGETLTMGDKPMTLGRAVARILSADQQGGKLKSFTLARNFMQQDKVDVDSADLKNVKDSVKRNEIFNNLVSGQVLEILEELNPDD